MFMERNAALSMPLAVWRKFHMNNATVFSRNIWTFNRSPHNLSENCESVTRSPNRTSEFWFTGDKILVYRDDPETRQPSYFRIATDHHHA